MNIFKVLASSRMSIREEHLSAIMAWFMNPYMEHGLGLSFLNLMVNEIAQALDDDDLMQSIDILQLKFRSGIGGDESDYPVRVALGYCPPNGSRTIDIVVDLDDSLLMFENKIDRGSIKDRSQFSEEYRQLRRSLSEEKRIIAVLVGPDDVSTKSLYEGLSELKGNDRKILLPWKTDDGTNRISVKEILGQILTKEGLAQIEPLSEYLRHTLKALIAFIDNDFQGYPWEGLNKPRSGIWNEESYAREAERFIKLEKDGEIEHARQAFDLYKFLLERKGRGLGIGYGTGQTASCNAYLKGTTQAILSVSADGWVTPYYRNAGIGMGINREYSSRLKELFPVYARKVDTKSCFNMRLKDEEDLINLKGR